MGTIAGIEVGLPETAEAMDAAWMQSVLRTSGEISETTTVESIAVEDFAGGGLLSMMHKCTLTYGGGDGPSTLMVKSPHNVPHQRATADAFTAYNKEVSWYRDIAPRSNVRTPKIHAAIINDDASHYCVVMEDLGGLTQASRDTGATWDQAISALDALAAYHSSWTGSDELDELKTTYFGLDSPVYAAVLPQIFAQGWPIAQQHGADFLSDEVIAFGDRWVELMPAMMAKLLENPTLCHCDWRTDNLFFDDNGETIAVDPQLIGVNNPAYDVGYLIVTSMDYETYEGRFDELVGRYVDQSAVHGVELDREKVAHDARVMIAFCLIYCVGSFPSYDMVDQSGKDVMKTFMRRVCGAMDELNAAPLVYAL